MRVAAPGLKTYPYMQSASQKKLKFNLYIVASILSHILLIGVLGLTRSFTGTAPTVFNVDIVELTGSRGLPGYKAVKPVIPKKKPPLVKRRRTPPENKLKPETLYSEGPALPENGNENNSPASPYLERDSLPQGKDAPSLVPGYDLFDKKTIEKFASKGFPSKKGLTFDTSEFRGRGYMRMLKERIERIWKYPDEAARRGISGDLYMKFSIKKDGSLGEIEILRTSGYRDLDEAAMKAIKSAEPFWPLPDDWDKDPLEIKGHFIYIFGNTYVM